MRGFGEVAVVAAERLSSGKESNPVRAWEFATRLIFSSSEDLQRKSCPKGAFLGLCNEGLIVGFERGNYSKLTKNGMYAVRAVEILQQNRFIATQPELLWKKVAGSAKTANSQMEVVVALWQANRLTLPSTPVGTTEPAE